MNFANVGIYCFLASYLVAFVLEATRLWGRSKANRLFVLLFAAAGLCAHTIYLLVRSRATNLPPLVGSQQDWMLVLAWLMVLFYLVFTFLDETSAWGVFILPVVLLVVAATYLVGDAPKPLLASQQNLKMVHAGLLVIGIGGVTIGFVIGMMYLVQHRRLKRKHGQTTGLSMPSLARLARWNRLCVMLSFPLLTAGMLTGVGLGLYSKRTPEPVQFLDPVIIGYGVVWLVMAVLFGWLLRAKPAAGKQVAWMTIWGCGFLLLTIVGLQVLNMDSWHS
ncbi:cytochrome c biogenesis protein CcsA [Symmachiella dynata]|uniref:Cytochrome C assembly protein n=1 Tax=Symmachiella dynata TaxID=2527995 RepID=A0A517ZWB8_9PLAN|nr:cytochrome c biogenesis protein CcsA [Symmachiella dynata]QDT51126.1 Cytochrome C assembly protein [Symmachiella dynata]QDU46803.1 Cytochrome C assembly protein [Symmachiella dynata]